LDRWRGSWRCRHLKPFPETNPLRLSSSPLRFPGPSMAFEVGHWILGRSRFWGHVFLSSGSLPLPFDPLCLSAIFPETRLRNPFPPYILLVFLPVFPQLLSRGGSGHGHHSRARARERFVCFDLLRVFTFFLFLFRLFFMPLKLFPRFTLHGDELFFLLPKPLFGASPL